MLPLDNQQLAAYFETALRDHGLPGKVWSCTVAPDYRQILEFNNRREKVMMRYSQFHDDPPVLKVLCSKSYLHFEDYLKEMQELDLKIDRHICRPVVASCTAFLCMDSLETVVNMKSIIK